MSNNSVNTTSTGDEHDSSDGGNSGILWILGILITLSFPIVALAGVATWLTFSLLRIRRSVIAGFLVIYLVILGLVSLFFNFVNVYVQTWTVDLPNLIANHNNVVSNILNIVVKQIPVSIPVGIIIGLLYSSWRWFLRPKWEETVFRITPMQWLSKRRNIRDIANDQNGPMNGTTLGIAASDGHKIIQLDSEASSHTLVVGAAGSGKTTTLMGQSRDIIRRGHALCFVDLKGGTDVPRILEEYARRYNRTFRHWLMHPSRDEYKGPSDKGPAYYDPISRGEASRRKDLIIGARKWSEEYYKTIAEDYLQKAFEVLIGNPDKNVSTFSDIANLLDPKTLGERSYPLGHIPYYRELVEEIARMNDEKMPPQEKSAISSLRKQFQVLAHSVAGPWLKRDPQGENDINLKDVANAGDIVVFSLDSSNYPELSQTLGNLIIQDLKTVSSELRQDPSANPLHVFIDEFSAIGSDNVIGLISKSRDAGVPVTLSTQALGDLRKVDDSFLDQLVGIISSFLIHRANIEEDAEFYAGLTGIEIKKKFRQSVEHSSNIFGIGRGSGSGSGVLEDVEEHRVTVSEIQSLRTGEMVYVSKSPFRLERVIVIPETDKLADTDNKPIVVLPNAVFTAKYDQPVISPIELEEGVRPPSITRPANVDRVSEIFNRPADQFLTKTARDSVDYDKHFLPPKKTVIVEPEEAPKQQNVAPPVMVLPPRKPINPNPSPSLTKEPNTPVVIQQEPKAPTAPLAPAAVSPLKQNSPQNVSKDEHKDQFDF